MSVDYWLFRVPFERDDPSAEQPPFGSQEEVVNQLCSQPGFTLHRKETLENGEPWAVIVYITENEEGEESDVEFSLQGDPVMCISINRASQEGFLPIIAVFSELAPFEIVDIDGEAMSPNELFRQHDLWVTRSRITTLVHRISRSRLLNYRNPVTADQERWAAE